MKIAILGDTHLGVRNDSLYFHRYFETFLSTVFFPYILENNIKVVLQLGDLFDRRKYINFHTLIESRNYFFDVLEKNNIKLITLLGNHDLYWKESLSVSSSDLLLKDYNNITVIDKPLDYTLDTENKFEICIIPWICKENYEECISTIQNSKTHLCVGHFEISGFSMYKGVQSHGGLDSSIFKKFETVLTGHYHHKSRNDNILYVGTPYEMTWQDYNDERGFHVYDFQTRSIEFIKNPYSMFYKIMYDDSEENYSEYSVTEFSEKYIKVVVKNKTNPYMFDTFISMLQSMNPIDITIIEDIYEIIEEELENIDEAEDTVTILNRYIDNLKPSENVDSNKLKTIMRGLYDEALNLERI